MEHTQMCLMNSFGEVAGYNESEFIINCLENVMSSHWPQPKTMHCRICNYKEFLTDEALQIHTSSIQHMVYEKNYDVAFCLACQVHCGDASGMEIHKKLPKHIMLKKLLEDAKKKAHRYWKLHHEPDENYIKQSNTSLFVTDSNNNDNNNDKKTEDKNKNNSDLKNKMSNEKKKLIILNNNENITKLCLPQDLKKNTTVLQPEKKSIVHTTLGIASSKIDDFKTTNPVHTANVLGSWNCTVKKNTSVQKPSRVQIKSQNVTSKRKRLSILNANSVSNTVNDEMSVEKLKCNSKCAIVNKMLKTDTSVQQPSLVQMKSQNIISERKPLSIVNANAVSNTGNDEMSVEKLKGKSKCAIINKMLKTGKKTNMMKNVITNKKKKNNNMKSVNTTKKKASNIKSAAYVKKAVNSYTQSYQSYRNMSIGNIHLMQRYHPYGTRYSFHEETNNYGNCPVDWLSSNSSSVINTSYSHTNFRQYNSIPYNTYQYNNMVNNYQHCDPRVHTMISYGGVQPGHHMNRFY